MRTPRSTPPLYLTLILPLVIAACGGGGDDDMQRALDDLLLADIAAEQALDQAEFEATQREIEERHNNRPRAQPHEYDRPETPEQRAERERQEAEAERLRLEEEAEYERRRQEAIAENERLLQEALARGEERARQGAYLPWGYHEAPEFQMFGAWQETPPNAQISLLGGSVKAGVVFHNGEYVPWMRGQLTGGSLYSGNSNVRFEVDEYGYREYTFRDARWNGSLVGVTPEGQAVTGNATLSDFDFGPPDAGTAHLAFTGLTYADGTTWGDGDLQYQVGVGKTFGGHGHTLDSSFSHPFRQFNCSRHVNGCANDSISIAAGVREKGYSTSDAGEVRGLFFGPEHEAIAGTLQRDDLTAVFGGER